MSMIREVVHAVKITSEAGGTSEKGTAAADFGVVGELSAKGFRVLNENRARIGIAVVNQHPTATFWLTSEPEALKWKCKPILPNSIIIEDILPGQEAVYVMTDLFQVTEAYLTIIEKFQTKN